MKPRLIYRWILGSFAFYSQLSMSFAFEKTSIVEPFYKSTMEIQEDLSEVTESIKKTVQDLLILTPNQRTFENTLMPWNEALAQLRRSINLLNAIATTQSFQSPATFEMLGNFHSLLIEIAQCSQLSDILIGCAEKSLQEQELNPFQRYIARHFLSNDASEYIHVLGTAQEKESDEVGFTILSLNPLDGLRSNSSDLARRILSTNADVICIQETYAHDACNLYEVLHSSYAHFLYMDADVAALPMLNYDNLGGFFIASKFPLERIQLSKFQHNHNNSNEVIVDFLIKNGEILLGHVYAVNFKNDPSSNIQANKFMEIAEKMHSDFSNAEVSIPFFLCGDFKALQGREKSEFLIDSYFTFDGNAKNNAHALLLQTQSDYLKNINIEDSSLTTSRVIVGTRSGLRSVVGKEHRIKDDLWKNKDEANVTLCNGHAELSVSTDSDGNASADASVSTSKDTDYGTFSAEVSGGVKQDRDGNTSSHVEGTVSWDW